MFSSHCSSSLLSGLLLNLSIGDVLLLLLLGAIGGSIIEISKHVRPPGTNRNLLDEESLQLGVRSACCLADAEPRICKRELIASQYLD